MLGKMHERLILSIAELKTLSFENHFVSYVIGMWDLVALRNHANRVVERALDESTWHVDEECLFGKSIYVASHDGVWHADRNCGGEHYDVVLHQRLPCPQCAHEMSTPWIPDNRTGVSLHRDLENFLEQSAQVRGESEEGK